MQNRHFLITEKFDAGTLLDNLADKQALAAGTTEDPQDRAHLELEVLELRRDAARVRASRRLL